MLVVLVGMLVVLLFAAGEMVHGSPQVEVLAGE